MFLGDKQQISGSRFSKPQKKLKPFVGDSTLTLTILDTTLNCVQRFSVFFCVRFLKFRLQMNCAQMQLVAFYLIYWRAMISPLIVNAWQKLDRKIYWTSISDTVLILPDTNLVTLSAVSLACGCLLQEWALQTLLLSSYCSKCICHKGSLEPFFRNNLDDL